MSIAFEELDEYAEYLPPKCFRVSDSNKAHGMAQRCGAIATANKIKSSGERQRVDDVLHDQHETHWIIFKSWTYQEMGYYCVWFFPKVDFPDFVEPWHLANADALTIQNR